MAEEISEQEEQKLRDMKLRDELHGMKLPERMPMGSFDSWRVITYWVQKFRRWLSNKSNRHA